MFFKVSGSLSKSRSDITIPQRCWSEFLRSSEAAVVVFRRLVPAGEGLLIVPVFGDFAVLHAEDVDVGAFLVRRRWRHFAQQPDELAFGRSADELEGWDRRRPRRARRALVDAFDQAR